MVEAPGIEGLKGCRRKPSRDVYLTNNRPTSLAFFVPSGSALIPRNSPLAARSRPYGVNERGACSPLRGSGVGSKSELSGGVLSASSSSRGSLSVCPTAP